MSNTVLPFLAVLFDVDGVVVRNTIELHLRVWDEFARSRGVLPTAAQLQGTNGRRAADVIDDWFGPNLPATRLTELVAVRESYYQERLRAEPLFPVAGLVDVLERLRAEHIRRALVTSGVPITVEIVLDKLRLTGAFDAIVTAADVTQGKPHPEPYLTGAASVGVPPERCLVVDDAPNGVRSGKAAGSCCLGLTTSASAADLVAAGADWVAEDFTSLPAELRF